MNLRPEPVDGQPSSPIATRLAHVQPRLASPWRHRGGRAGGLVSARSLTGFATAASVAAFFSMDRSATPNEAGRVPGASCPPETIHDGHTSTRVIAQGPVW